MASKKVKTDKQRVFVDLYLGECRFNATEAARRAGYKLPNKQGPRLLVNVGIRDLIEQRLAYFGMGANEVIARLTEQGRGSLAPFITVNGENVGLDLSTDQAQENIGLIKKIKTKRRRFGKEDNETEEFETEIELYDAQSALIQLGRHHGIFTDKLETDAPTIMLKIDR